MIPITQESTPDGAHAHRPLAGGADAVVTLADGGRVILSGIDAASLDAGDFIFG